MTTDSHSSAGAGGETPAPASATPTARQALTMSAEERRISRADSAYTEIADRLADLRFPPGCRFTEAEVAAELGMSKTPVREALLMHSAGGLITTRPGAGYIVMPITLKDVRALLSHWRRLAGDAVAIAVKRGIDSHVMVHLQHLTEEPETADINRGVFDVIFGVAEDTYLYRDYFQLAIEIERLFRLVLADGDSTLDDGLRRIIEVIATDDVKSARSVVISYIDRVESLVLAELLSGDLLLTAAIPASGRKPPSGS